MEQLLAYILVKFRRYFEKYQKCEFRGSDTLPRLDWQSPTAIENATKYTIYADNGDCGRST
jgi:hypothetical protein